MVIPIRNGSSTHITVVVEIEATEIDIPRGSFAEITLADNPKSLLEVRDNMMIIWNEGPGLAKVRLDGKEIAPGAVVKG